MRGQRHSAVLASRRTFNAKAKEDWMAMLIIGTGSSHEIKPQSFKDLLNGKLALDPSPELYLDRREVQKQPYIAEVYKLPISSA